MFVVFKTSYNFIHMYNAFIDINVFQPIFYDSYIYFALYFVAYIL